MKCAKFNQGGYMFYRLRNSIKYAIFNLQTKNILSTPPISMATSPKYSLHALVCERDLQMYLLSVKSFITRVKGAQVIAHSDGTLSNKSVDILKEHLPGIKIISRDAADTRAMRELDETLQKIRGYGGCFDRLIDSILWGGGGRCHIQMDSDILTTKHPRWIEKWVDDERHPFVIADYEKKDLAKLPLDSSKKEHIQTQLERNQAVIASKLGLDFGNILGLCAAFYGWQDQLKLEEITRFVTTCEALNIDMTQWGAEQVVTTWLLNARGADRLPKEDYINLQKCAFHLRNSASMIHFIGTHRFHNGWYATMAKREISRLMKLQ